MIKAIRRVIYLGGRKVADARKARDSGPRLACGREKNPPRPRVRKPAQTKPLFEYGGGNRKLGTSQKWRLLMTSGTSNNRTPRRNRQNQGDRK